MLSKLQAAIPTLANDLPVENWVNKIFPEKTPQKRKPEGLLEQREFFRLNMGHLPPLDATLISKNGANIDLEVLNISASGLCGKITPSVPLFKNQLLNVAFVLPFDEPMLVKTSTSLLSIDPSEFSDARVLRLQFSEGLDDWQRELIHVYVLKKQLELIQQRREWQTA
jgi:c-di-GMP-binding flagellar brake protein YcgR